jgi:Flp pilus assembly protein TadB
MTNYVEYSRCGRCGTKLPGRWSGMCNVCMQTVAVEKQLEEQKRQYKEQEQRYQQEKYLANSRAYQATKVDRPASTAPTKPSYASSSSGFADELSAFLLTLPLSAVCVYFVVCMFAWVGKFLFWMMTFGYVFARPFPSWIWYDWLNWIGF